jgi:hypothetical protein
LQKSQGTCSQNTHRVSFLSIVLWFSCSFLPPRNATDQFMTKLGHKKCCGSGTRSNMCTAENFQKPGAHPSSPFRIHVIFRLVVTEEIGGPIWHDRIEENLTLEIKQNISKKMRYHGRLICTCFQLESSNSSPRSLPGTWSLRPRKQYTNKLYESQWKFEIRIFILKVVSEEILDSGSREERVQGHT